MIMVRIRSTGVTAVAGPPFTTVGVPYSVLIDSNGRAVHK